MLCDATISIQADDLTRKPAEATINLAIAAIFIQEHSVKFMWKREIKNLHPFWDNNVELTPEMNSIFLFLDFTALAEVIWKNLSLLSYPTNSIMPESVRLDVQFKGRSEWPQEYHCSSYRYTIYRQKWINSLPTANEI